MDQLIHVTCRKCDRLMKFPQNMAGERYPCKQCKQVCIVPDNDPNVTRSAPVLVAEEEDIVRFTCPGCGKVRSAEREEFAGLEIACRKCQLMLTVPDRSGPVTKTRPITDPMFMTDRSKKKTVPVGLQMPNGLGGMQVEVTQQTANSMATTFLGGILVAIGVMLAAFFGGGKGKS